MCLIFEAHLETPEAQLDMARAESIVTARRAALLCFEANAAGCHRRIVAERLVRSVGAVEVDL
ncbi:DUF488 domain-containing protein [Thermohalobaculum sediminis]|uniref:DUF488 domain-containing protein n=1 Tax=Thermohalobaculum sediminis TaxID=2939436 RepID=UPI0022286939|nr:DUF488 domain-containing protein [Limibaculum sediminis]